MKSTKELTDYLSQASIKKYDEFIENNEMNIPVWKYLDEYRKDHGLSKVIIIERSLLERTYGYHILNGAKRPGRDKLLAICFGAQMPLEGFQRALNMNKSNELYPRDPRDAAIILCIKNEMYDLQEVNDFLYSREMDPFV